MNVSRRAFLSRGSLGVVVAGAAAFVPVLGPALKNSMTASMTPADMQAITEPLVAHVRDTRTGEISLMVGGDHVVVRDVDLAGRLHGAAAAAQPKAR